MDLPTFIGVFRLGIQPDLFSFRFGTKAYGYGGTLNADFNFGVKDHEAFDFQFGVASTECSAPQEPVACCIGLGKVLVTWKPPEDGVVDYYEVWASLDQNSGYEIYQGRQIQEQFAFLPNLPMRVLIYFRVRAVSKTGLAGPFAQVRKGTLQAQEIACEIRSIVGSKIKAGAIFTELLSNGNQFAVQFLETETIVNP